MNELAPNASADFTDDVFLGGKVSVRQPMRCYRAGIDAVLLAAAAPVGERVLDVGAGVGTVGLCVAARCADARVILVERETELLDLARHNIQKNGWSSRVDVVAADITRATANSLCETLKADSFDVVLANPPYHDDDAGTAARDALKAASNAMSADALDDWVRFLARMAAPGGRAVFIHKAEALPRLLTSFGKRFGAVRVLPIHPRIDEPAHRVLVGGVKGSRAPLTILPGFVMHAPGQGFTAEATAILRDGAPLALF